MKYSSIFKKTLEFPLHSFSFNRFEAKACSTFTFSRSKYISKSFINTSSLDKLDIHSRTKKQIVSNNILHKFRNYYIVINEYNKL